MRILVTGGQGCIGSWVVKLLAERGLDVIMYDSDAEVRRLAMIAEPRIVATVRRETGKIEDTSRIKSLVRDEQITHIVHLAAVLMPYCQANPVSGGMINVIGTLNLFEAARDAGRSVRIAYASSSAVWGPGEGYDDRALTETDAPRPATHYGVFKHANEENARVFYSLNGISSIGLRPWTVYGVGRDSGLTADPTLAIRALASNEPFQMRLSGFMDLQYVEDVAEAFIRCLLSPLEGAHIFNLAGDIVDLQEFSELLNSMDPGGRKLITASGPQVPVAFRMDDSALQSKVGAIPKTPLSDGVRKTLEKFRALAATDRI